MGGVCACARGEVAADRIGFWPSWDIQFPVRTVQDQSWAGLG